MDINAVELMKFLGYSTIHEPFDDFLNKHGVKKRPKVSGSTYELSIAVKKQGLHLNFLTPNKLNKEGVVAKSPGTYLFQGFEIYTIQDDGFSAYNSLWPFGLQVDQTQKQVRALLGEPKYVTFDEEWFANVDFYFLENLVVAIKYVDMEGTAISMISPRLPDNWARENGIAPAL